MADQDTSWRQGDFRRKVMGQIEEAISQTGNPTSKSSSEMENHVFQKAKSRDEYLALVARLILHVRDINSKKDKAMVNQQGMNVGGQQGALLNDTMSALQNLTRTPNSNLQGPSMQNQMMGGPMGIQQQRPPFQTYQQPGGIVRQPGAMPVQQQTMMGQQRMPGMQTAQENFMMQQQQTQQQPQQILQQQQLLQQQQQQQQQQQFHQQQNQIGLAAMGGVRPTAIGAPFSNPGQPIGFQQGASQASGMTGNPANITTGAPSPASVAVSSYATMASPAMLPSPGQTTIAPSPASKASAPSPGSQLNTPGNPGSIGPAPSPQASQTNAEEQAYLDKLKQLRKYIEPLKRMVAKIEKEEERKKDLNKMKNLLDILSDSSKRLPFGTLLKCEQVLEKLDFKTKGSTPAGIPVGSTTVHSTKADQQHMCQPLIDAVAQHVHNPMLNHTLNRTFGPAIQALHGTSIRSDSPPIKKLKTDDNEKDDGISNIVQGEIARLEHRFKVNLDPQHQEGSRTIRLICRLEDKNLPSVPALSVTVPEDYPNSSPTCNTSSDEYSGTPFLENVQKNLSSQLLNLPEKYSISALLDLWELSIRQMSSQNVADKYFW